MYQLLLFLACGLLLGAANSLAFLPAHVWAEKFPVAKETIRQSCRCWQLKSELRDSELVLVQIAKLRQQK